MQESSIIVEKLCKSYKESKRSTLALNEVSFKAEAGKIFGLIGPDGSGKTTLIRIIASLILPDTGAVSVGGLDPVKDYAKLRKFIGYMPGKFSLYQDLSVEENLNFFASVFNTTIKENYFLIEDIYKFLEPFKKRLAANLSGGMKQKLALCCALIHKPKILLLDEPTTGVDPVSRQDFWDLLLKLRKEGITILVSTPYMNEAERCDEISFILKGEIMEINKPAQIVEGFSKKILHVKSDNMFCLLKDLREHKNVEYAFAFGDTNHAVINGGDFDIGNLKTFLEKKAHKNLQIEFGKAEIEDCFMELSRHDKHH